MVMKVLISYRRRDIRSFAGRVYDRLKLEFGSDAVFMDVHAVPLGVDFAKLMDKKIAKCDVLLAIIGPGWLRARDEGGNRRLDNPHDFNRIEIAAALKRNIPVIPILVDDTRVPKADQLPDEIKELGLHNALNVRQDYFHSDMEKLKLHDEIAC